MRRLWVQAMVAVLAVGCASSPKPAPSPSSPEPQVHVNPANIKRVGRELPPGYEVTSVVGVSAPVGIWGFGAGWTADPQQCAALADPAHGSAESAQGVSGSGPGGIVYAVVAASPSGPMLLDRNVVAECGHWAMTAGRATASVHLIDAPQIDAVPTIGMVCDTTTSVEGGSEIDSRAYTFTAYLGDYYAFTTLMTDPGSAHRSLPAQFAADLLVKTVAALRG